jgi:hypothetical protein
VLQPWSLSIGPFCRIPPPPLTPRRLGVGAIQQTRTCCITRRRQQGFFQQDICYCTTEPLTPSPLPSGVFVSYCLYPPNGDKSCFSGSAVVCLQGLCSLVDACPNRNMFQLFFEIEFYHKNHTHVRGIFQFKFACCFGSVKDLTYHLSKPVNKFCLDAAAPALSSAWLLTRYLTA